MSKYQVRSIQMRKPVLEWAKASGSVKKAFTEWRVARSMFRRWKEGYDKEGETRVTLLTGRFPIHLKS